jgi:hypothetical protein
MRSQAGKVVFWLFLHLLHISNNRKPDHKLVSEPFGSRASLIESFFDDLADAILISDQHG